MTPDFIINNLKKVTNPLIKSGEVFIICPFHLDSSPSLGVSLGTKIPIGIFHCFGCGASGKWNRLAVKLGLETINDKNSEDYYEPQLSSKIEIYNPIFEDDLNLSKLKKSWKSYKAKFLRSFGIKLLWEEKLKDYFLYVPVHYVGDYKGHIRVRLYESSTMFKYWFNLKEKIFYPYDFILNCITDTVVLVEGIADAYRLLQYNIPTLATLGTQFNLENGYEYLYSLGIKNIIFMYDGDEAGKKAIIGTEEKEGLFTYFSKDFNCRFLFPPKGKDPDNMPISYVKFILKLYNSLTKYKLKVKIND